MKHSGNKPLLLAMGVFLFFIFSLAPASFAARLAVGDYNADGFPDLAILIRGACVIISNGDGTFQPPVCYPAGPAPVSILTGDLDNNGTLDLVTLTPERGPIASGVAVLLGNGDGTFLDPPPLYPAGAYPRLFSLADINADGFFDLAVVGLGGPCRLIGQGDGTFGEPSCFSLRGFSDSHTLLTPDVNADGSAEFLGVAPNNICFWSGSTREPICTGTRVRSRLADLGEFTADGLLDVAIVGSDPTGVNAACAYAGNGEGAFQLAECSRFRTMVNITQLVAADFDNNGNFDLALAGSGRAGGEFLALLGNGQGGFEPNFRQEVPIAPVIEALATADFNVDGLVDVIITGSGRACIFTGDGTGGFGRPNCFTYRKAE